MLFWRLAERILTATGSAIALFLFAIGVPFIRFGAEVKQYECDLLAAIVLPLLVLRLLEGEVSMRRLATTGLAGFVVIWFSQASVLVMAGNFQQLFSYVVFGGWIFYGLSVLGVISLRRKEPDKPRPYRTPLYPWLPLLFVLMASFLIANSLWNSPLPSLFALAFLVCGVPVYWLKRKFPEV